MVREITLALALFTFAGCVSSQPPRPLTPRDLYPGEPTIRVQVGDGPTARIRELPLEEYVRGSVLAEAALGSLDPVVAERMARVQAILARTYALANLRRHAAEGFDLCSTTHCQLFLPAKTWTDQTSRLAGAAASETRGIVIVEGDHPIQAVFHSDCGGHTSPAGAVWGGTTPSYLRGAPDTVGSKDAHSTWRFSVDAERLQEALNRDQRTRVGDRLDRVDVIQRDIAARVVRVVLDGSRAPMVRGEELRVAVTRSFGPDSLRSTQFTVRRDGNRFVFEGRGYGHGVGLCQSGALARARAGQSVQAIFAHYYPGTRLDRLTRVVPTS